jgi:hypothetical protein
MGAKRELGPEMKRAGAHYDPFGESRSPFGAFTVRAQGIVADPARVVVSTASP